jgi:hypothetical protein
LLRIALLRIALLLRVTLLGLLRVALRLLPIPLRLLPIPLRLLRIPLRLLLRVALRLLLCGTLWCSRVARRVLAPAPTLVPTAVRVHS